MLYIVQTGLLDLPILYLSRYINQYKADYYKLLQVVRDDNDWESWLGFMLSAVESTAIYTITQIEEVKKLIADYKKNNLCRECRLTTQCIAINNKARQKIIKHYNLGLIIIFIAYLHF